VRGVVAGQAREAEQAVPWRNTTCAWCVATVVAQRHCGMVHVEEKGYERV